MHTKLSPPSVFVTFGVEFDDPTAVAVIPPFLPYIFVMDHGNDTFCYYGDSLRRFVSLSWLKRPRSRASSTAAMPHLLPISPPAPANSLQSGYASGNLGRSCGLVHRLCRQHLNHHQRPNARAIVEFIGLAAPPQQP
ncbi:MAG: hypothetical protein ACRES9_05505 [Gammaproteobacteria bacterium]